MGQEMYAKHAETPSALSTRSSTAAGVGGVRYCTHACFMAFSVAVYSRQEARRLVAVLFFLSFLGGAEVPLLPVRCCCGS